LYGGAIRQVSVAFHGAKSIHPKTMRSIVRQSGIPQEEWMRRKTKQKSLTK
jgi:uncharacterized protein (DUF2384 family)